MYCTTVYCIVLYCAIWLTVLLYNIVLYVIFTNELVVFFVFTCPPLQIYKMIYCTMFQNIYILYHITKHNECFHITIHTWCYHNAKHNGCYHITIYSWCYHSIKHHRCYHSTMRFWAAPRLPSSPDIHQHRIWRCVDLYDANVVYRSVCYSATLYASYYEIMIENVVWRVFWTRFNSKNLFQWFIAANRVYWITIQYSTWKNITIQ